MSTRIRKWFDQFESVLRAQAKLAGLLEHKPTIGHIREFFIQQVLTKFLPSGLTVGSGKVMSSENDQMSKQIDIIIFDNRFPKFSITGLPFEVLYPVEGVVATIEIKSTLNSKTLKKALDNSYSVVKLSGQINHADHVRARKAIMKTQNIGEKAADQVLLWTLGPRTYIFAFEGYKENYNALAESVLEWTTEKADKREMGNYYAPGLPRVIVGEGVTGVTRDEKFIMDGDNIFMAFQINIQFGLLASHLLAVIQDRLRPTYARLNVAYSISGHNPMRIYDKEFQTAKRTTIALDRKPSL